MAWVGAPGDEGFDVGRFEDDLGVEDGVLIGGKGLPVFDGALPFLALGSVRTVFEVFEGRFVGGDHSGSGTGLDRHIAHRHAPLHGEFTDRLSPVFEDVTLAPTGSDLRDDGKDDVFRGRPLRQGTVHGDRHRLEGGEWQGLGREDVFNLAGPNAESEGSEGAVCGGVRVAADDRHAGLGQSELRADDVHDSLVGVAEGVQADPEFLRVLAKGVDLQAARLVGDRQVDVEGRSVVVLGGDRQLRAADLAACEPEPFEGLGARHLVDKVEVDVEQVGGSALALLHDVVAPHLLCHCAGHASSLVRAFRVCSAPRAKNCEWGKWSRRVRFVLPH